MTIKEIASKIPDDIRSLRLLNESDPIHSAKISLEDEHMKLLVKVWDTFIEPHKETGTCPICLNNIKTNFIQMYDTLVDLENDYKKLKMI